MPAGGDVARAARLVAGLGLILGLAACGAPQLPCPAAHVLKAADHVVRFGAGAPSKDNIDYVGQINAAKLSCSYDPNTYEKLTVALGVQISAARGAANTSGGADLRYFVAIVNLQGQVLAKKVFPLHLAFPPGKDTVSKIEEIDQNIPLKYPQNGSSIQIWTGFQISEAEVKFNERYFAQ